MTNRIELSLTERFFFAGGHEFGSVGTYERLIGRAHFAVEPGASAQRGITDIVKSPTDAEGLVRFTGDFSILKPVDPALGNRRLFFDAATSECCSSSTTRRPPTIREPWRMPATAF